MAAHGPDLTRQVVWNGPQRYWSKKNCFSNCYEFRVVLFSAYLLSMTHELYFFRTTLFFRLQSYKIWLLYYILIEYLRSTVALYCICPVGLFSNSRIPLYSGLFSNSRILLYSGLFNVLCLCQSICCFFFSLSCLGSIFKPSSGLCSSTTELYDGDSSGGGERISGKILLPLCLCLSLFFC